MKISRRMEPRNSVACSAVSRASVRNHTSKRPVLLSSKSRRTPPLGRLRAASRSGLLSFEQKPKASAAAPLKES